MTEQRNESLMDKVKDALGMGDDDRARDDGLAEDREPGFGGVGQMMDDRDTDATMGHAGFDDGVGGTGLGRDADSSVVGDVGTANRPGGPDYAAPDGTTLTGAGTSEWGRGEAASGETPFGTAGQDDEEDLGLEGTNRPD